MKMCLRVSDEHMICIPICYSGKWRHLYLVVLTIVLIFNNKFHIKFNVVDNFTVRTGRARPV